MRRMNMVAFAILTWTCLGCGKPNLEHKSKFKLVEGETKTLDLDPIKQEQVIKVIGSTSGGPVSVYIYLEKDKQAAEREIFNRKPAAAVLAKQEKTETIDLEASIPANEKAYVRVENIRGTPTVDLQITNR